MNKSPNLSVSFVLFLLFIIVAGCSSKKDEPVISTAPYIGEWESGCALHPQATSSAYLAYSFNIEATEFEFILSSYFDENCTTQMPSAEQAGSRRGTLTYTGTYVDGGIVTSADGLEANSLLSTVTSVTSTLDKPGDNPNPPIANEFDFLVHVNDADVLFVGESLVGFTDTPDSRVLALTVPFNRK